MNAQPHLPPSVELAGDPVTAASGAQAVVLMTEWDQIVGADWADIAGRMRPPRFLFDGRNALDQARMTRSGFEYVGVGRPAASGFRSSGEHSSHGKDATAS